MASPSIRFAVTGASGFVGRYVVRCLLAEGHSVTAISRNTNSLSHFQGEVQLLECDIGNLSNAEARFLADHDSLIHLAWDGLPNFQSLFHYSEQLPLQYRFLTKLIECGLPNLVITGTCLEYGMVSGCLNEIRNKAAPITPYGFAKFCLLEQLLYLKRETSFNLTWARLFYLYGEGQAESSLYSQLKKAAQAGKVTFDMSGGEQLRDFSHVTDIASKLKTLATMTGDIGVVNLCSGKPRSVRRIVETWMNSEGWDLHLNLGYYPYPTYEPLAFWGDCSRFESLTAGSGGLK